MHVDNLIIIFIWYINSPKKIQYLYTHIFGGKMTTEQLISLPVYSINEQNIVGIVTNVYIYRKKITALLITDETSFDEYILFTKDIYSFGQAIVLITNLSKLHLHQSVELQLAKYTTPLGKHFIKLDGSIFDIIKNIEFDGKFNILNIYHGNNKTDIKNVTILSNCCIFSNHLHKKAHPVKTKFPKFDNLKDVKVEIQDKQFSGIASLVGKHTTKDILSQNGEVLVKKNSKITSGLIAKLSYLGKLNELQLYSK